MRLDTLKLVFKHFELIGEKAFVVELFGLSKQVLGLLLAAARHGHGGELHFGQRAVLLPAEPRIQRLAHERLGLSHVGLGQHQSAQKVEVGQLTFNQGLLWMLKGVELSSRFGEILGPNVQQGQ